MTVIDNALSGLPSSERLGDELSSLFERRASLFHDVAVHRAMGDLENNDPYHRAVESLRGVDRRISDLQSVIDGSTCAAGADDGTVRIGSVATVQFGNYSDDVETFTLVGSAGLSDPDSADTCSATSPLGSVLLGCRAGEVRTYELPTGRSCTVRVLTVATHS